MTPSNRLQAKSKRIIITECSFSELWKLHLPIMRDERLAQA